MNDKIALVGYRATGKSTIASRLAQFWNVPQLDSDVEIEKRERKTIAEIFRDDGEPRFRDIEAETIAEILSAPETVVLSTGGGAPLRESTRRILKERSIVFWLTASVETIARRMLGDVSTASRRPALTNARSPVAEIADVLRFREPLYSDAAAYVVNTEDKTIDEIVNEIVGLVDRRN